MVVLIYNSIHLALVEPFHKLLLLIFFGFQDITKERVVLTDIRLILGHLHHLKLLTVLYFDERPCLLILDSVVTHPEAAPGF